MSFQSLDFLAFVAAVTGGCLLVARRTPWAAKLLLTVGCIGFCLDAGLRGFLVLCCGAAVSLAAVKYLAADRPQNRRRAAMIAAAAWHIVVLAVFKYTGFVTGGAASVGWVPLGLSFFTFQQLWLLKEVYTREYVPQPGDDLLLYAFFFPSVTSGPILRPGTFFPQVRSERFLRPTWEDAAAGICGICVGTAKKVLLADAFGVVVNNGWNGAAASAPAAWLTILGYTMQLYFDFSGYCDIAAGCARLLGIRLPMNFDSPYRSLSVTEFWKRWHITLTTFLRECVYFPLGGSRKGAARAYLNILLVFLISGIWHGAGWTFIVWGLLHGLAQIAERLLGKRTERLPKVLRWALMFLFVNLAWVFFRAPDLASAWALLKTAFTGGSGLPLPALAAGLFPKERAALQLLLSDMESNLNVLLVSVLYGAGAAVVLYPRSTARDMEEGRCPGILRCVLLAAAAAWAVLSFTGVTTFIYSNF
ncbi:MAG: MBOAT family protein [Ruminococcaceae bacterium]|nr:MBOAT family protein [Oscillospiraceae bacterium]